MICYGFLAQPVNHVTYSIEPLGGYASVQISR